MIGKKWYENVQGLITEENKMLNAFIKSISKNNFSAIAFWLINLSYEFNTQDMAPSQRRRHQV